ncbi:MAG: YkgJ family cysteine cluster protein [Candidatus Omnitrophota bacterium]
MIKQIIPSEFCLSCRGCCRFAQPETSWSPVLLDSEIRQLLEDNYPPSLISKTKRIRPVPDTQSDRFLCAFLSPDDFACKIYSSRPLDCRLYPFMINRKGNKVFLACDLRCLFVEKNLGAGEFKEYIQCVFDFLNSPPTLNLLKNNPQMIQEYEGLLDLQEIKI